MATRTTKGGSGLKHLRNRQTQSAKKEKTLYEQAAEQAAEAEEEENHVALVHFEDIFAVPKPNTEGLKSEKRRTRKEKKGKRNTESAHEDERKPSNFDVDFASEISSTNSARGTEYSTTTMEDVFGPLEERDFEVSNPTLPAQEVVYDILSKGGNTMTLARKLYLLEQLKNQPAPSKNVPKMEDRPEHGGPPPKLPSRKKRRPSRARPLSFRLTGLGLNGETKKVKSKAQKLADETLTGPSGELKAKSLIAKAKQVGADGYWKLTEISKLDGQMDDFQVGLYLRIELLRDVCRIIRNIHEKETTHGNLNAENVLIDRNLEVSILQVESINQEGSELRKQYDVLGFGVIVLEFMTNKSVAGGDFPKLFDAIKLEERSDFTEAGAEAIYEEIEAIVEDVEKEVKDALKDTMFCPASLQELCVQSCSPDRFKRPQAGDAYEWADSLLEEVVMDKIKDSKVNVLVALLSNKQSFESVIEGPSIINQKGARAEDYAQDDDEGYETDDSFVPPVSEQENTDPEEKPKKKPNALSAFLQQTSDQNEITIPSTKSVNGLENELSEEGETSGRERGRSLDLGYEHAKNKIKPDLYASDVIGSSTRDLVKEIVIDAKNVERAFGKDIDPEALARRFEIQDRLAVEEAVALVTHADDILREEPNLVQLEGPVNVVGDIHGQFFDLRNMLRLGGPPGEVVGTDEDGKELRRTYCFLGDYVDRGAFSCEVILYLFALKVKYPEHIWLLRGNHESRVVASYFGFKEECSMKYGIRLFNACAQAFQSLPIGATVNTYGGKWLCLHGGISPNVTSLHQFTEFDRFAEPSMTGFLCDILWSDPISDSFEDGGGQSLGEFLSIDFLPNPVRGCSYRYGYRALIQFLAVNGLVGIIRAHEVQEEGYRFHFQEITGKKGDSAAQVTPPVITVFSAPNYCGRYGNKAAFIRMSKDLESHQAMLSGRKTKVKKKKKGGFFGKRKKKHEHNMHRAIRPLELVEPVQFEAVYSPEPLMFENEERKQQLNIEMVCPYMPTTFSAFIRKALELEGLETEEDKNMRGSVIETKKRRDSLVVPKRKDDPPERPKNWKAIQKLGLDEADIAGVSAPEPVKKVKTKAEIQRGKEYQEAASADGISEMNPALIEKTIRKAQKVDMEAIQAALPDNIRIESDEVKRRESMRRTSEKISFTKNEITALQALFFIIDRENKGQVDAHDLVTWSKECGQYTSDQESAACLDFVDIDRDGYIGFGDYLAFAAKNKELWLKSQFTKVLGQVKMLRERHGTLTN